VERERKRQRSSFGLCSQTLAAMEKKVEVEVNGMRDESLTGVRTT
jgi:hypothetical protein